MRWREDTSRRANRFKPPSEQVVIACIVMACIVMACIDMALVMACIVMACMVMAYIVMDTDQSRSTAHMSVHTCLYIY